MFLFAGTAVLLWMLDASLASEADFNSVADHLTNPWCKFILWSVLAGLAYHTVMGVRHLIMDFGVGESLEGGKLSAVFAFVLAGVLMVLAGVWIW